MKIVCDNCATKYSIADEKVRGKVFKIRCKKCSHIIVVRGSEGGGAAAEAAKQDDGGFPGDEAATMAAGGMPGGGGGGGGAGSSPPAAASDAVWHLVIDREQVGPLTPPEVRAKFAAGEVDVETYAWREGFADWLRLGSIEDFRDLGAAAAQSEEGQTRRTDSADLFAQSAASDDGGGDAGADLFGGAMGGAANAPAPMAAAPSGGNDAFSGGGLFGAPEEAAPAKPARQPRQSSPGFGANGGSGSGAQAAVSDDGGKMTGQRNENSVLFSLNNLQALASGGGGNSPGSGNVATAKPGVEQRPGFANSQTEGSGLIDIRAMAASTLSSGPGPGGGPSSNRSDGPNLDAAPIFSPMAAPILMPAAPSGPPKWMWPVLGVGGAAVIGIIVVGILLLTRKPELPVAPPTVATNTPPGPGTATPPGPGTATPPGPGTATPPGPGTATPPEVKADAPKEPKEPKEHGTHVKGKKEPKPGAVARPGNDSPTSGVVPPPSEKPAASKPGKKKDNLDDLLNGAAPEKSTPAEKPRKAEPAVDDSLPDQLDKGAIQGGMSKVKGKVGGCYEQFKVPGMANVQVTIGKNGHVSSANVSGSFAGTPTGSCVEKVVKGASFGAFKGSPMTFTYPFILR